MKRIFTTLLLLFIIHFGYGQENTLKITAYEGVIVSGYVDQGAYLNFTGPNLGLTFRQSKIMIGMLPSLRFKNDTNTPKNAFVTPTLGLGLTYLYKSIAIQLPMYYNAKTSKSNGAWNFGIGIGIKLSVFKKQTPTS